MTQIEVMRLKSKFIAGIPFSAEDRKKILRWKIMDVLKKSGGEMSVGELYKKLEVKGSG